jgi:hypothetical protein
MGTHRQNSARQTQPIARGNSSSPRPVIIYGPPPSSRRRGSFAGVAWPFWLVLGLSITVLAGTRTYARRVETRLAASMRPSPTFLMITPAEAVRAGDLRLSWQSVEGAIAYRLHVESITGSIVIDGLRVSEPDWIPPFDALPALTRGEYRWSVEALDASDQPICRSEPEPFRIL